MPLLDPSCFAPLMLPLQGSRIGFLRMWGNAGDRLIDDAAEQLFDEFDIEYGLLNWEQAEPGLADRFDAVVSAVDMVVVSGGGNLGTLYRNCLELRHHYLGYGKPVIILPQSITDTGGDLSAYHSVYLRERASLELWPRGTLAPDLALGFTTPHTEALRDHATGVFLREDGEALFAGVELSLGDPIECCDTALDYLALAGRFRHLVTDRLHFAVAGLLMGARVELLPNGYHKNRSMYETWLRDLGCGWRDDLDGLVVESIAQSPDLFHQLSAPPAGRLEQEAVPARNPDWTVRQEEDTTVLLDRPDSEQLRLNHTATEIRELCDGVRRVEDINDRLVKRFGAPPLAIARGVQTTLNRFLHCDVISLRHLDGKLGAAPPRGAMPRYERAHELYVYPTTVAGARARRSAFIRLADGRGGRTLWFETDARHLDRLSDRADPFVLACLMRAMRDHAALIVRGAPVSEGLIENLHHFQEAWASWYGQHEVISILPEHTRSSPSADASAVCAFSGGVDSTYTVFRHLLAPYYPWALPLRAALMVRGFDIYISSRRSFGAAVERARRQLTGLELELIELDTNIREIYSDWPRFHGLAAGAALSLFSGEFSHGLIASTVPYTITYPWGSNPLTDPMMGSNSFALVHDGAGTGRLQKLDQMRDWDTAIRDLRFCYVADRPDRNCGRCEKCLTTAIQLSVLNIEMNCFDQPPTDEAMIACLENMSPGPLDYFDLLAIQYHAHANALTFPWLPALHDSIERQRTSNEYRQQV